MKKETVKAPMLTGAKKVGTDIRPSSAQKGTGSANYYNHVPKSSIQNQK
jgi:hypothetical protein